MNPQVLRQDVFTDEKTKDQYLMFQLNNCDVYVVYNSKIIPIGNTYNRFGIWAPNSWTAFTSYGNAFLRNLENEATFHIACSSWEAKFGGNERGQSYYNLDAWQATFTPARRQG